MIMDIENRDSYDIIESFIKSSIDYMNHVIKKIGKLPLKEKEIPLIERNDTGKTITFQTINVPDINGFIFGLSEELINLPQSERLVELILEYEKTPERKENSIFHIKHNIVLSLLRYYFRINNEELIFNNESVKILYESFLNYYTNKEFKLKSIVLLENFKCDAEIILEENLKIRKISSEEHNELYEQSKNQYFGFVHIHNVFNIESVIESVYEIKKGEGQHNGNMSGLFDKIVSCLRLLKKGYVKFTVIITKNLSWHPFSGMQTGQLNRNSNLIGMDYEISENEIKEIKKLWTTLNQYNFNENKFLDIALKRFNYAYERVENEDKLIDFMISFESLFLKESEKSELNYKLALRISKFIEGDSKEIYYDLKKAYNLRSRVVHGSSKDLRNEIGQIVDKVENYLRKSIRKFMEQNKPQSKLIKELDENIIKSS